MVLSDKEQKVLQETRLRNLKRKYARLTQHADLTNEAMKVKNEIDSLENQLN